MFASLMGANTQVCPNEVISVEHQLLSPAEDVSES